MREKDIKQTISRGGVVHTPYVRIHLFTPPQSTQPAQFACIVSKKINPSAVQRHRYQRWLRAIIQPLLNTMPLGTNLVLIAKPAIRQTVSQQQLSASLLPPLLTKLSPPA